jgi:hypothetical protein
MPTPSPRAANDHAHHSNARWAKPLPKPRKNLMPERNFLAYQWVDKDPDLDVVKYAIEASGKSAEWIERETEKHSHKVSRYTILNWCFGSTKRPQNASMNMVMHVLGWSRPWVQG